MAEIIKKGCLYTPNEIYDNTCIHCGTVANVMFEEAFMGEYGHYIYKCPHCGKFTPLDEYLYNNREDMTFDNVTYPVNFHYVSEPEYDTSDGEITTIVRDILYYLRDTKKECETVVQGDTIIFVLRRDDDDAYHVFVGKNFEHTEIEYTGEDYRYTSDVDDKEEDTNNEDNRE